MKRVLQVGLLLLLAGASLPAQTFNLTDQRVHATALQGLWRFHTGDNPAWADPDFDDSKWALLHSYEPWGLQGYANYGGFGWYRFKVTVPAGFPKLTLAVPPINNCYQIFANGQLIGSYGKMPPDPVPFSGGAKLLYPIPPAQRGSDSGYTIVFAIRVWEWPAYAGIYGGGPLYGGALVGSSATVEGLIQQDRESLHWQHSSRMILALLESLAALGAFTLFLLRRSEREYLWFALVMLCSASAQWLQLSRIFTIWHLTLYNQIEAVLFGPATILAEIAFYFHLLKGRRTPLFWIAIACTFVSIPFNLFSNLFNLKIADIYLVQDSLGLPAYFWILAILFTRARSNYLDARLLVAPVVLQKGTYLFQQACILTFALGWQNKLAYWITITDQPFEILLVQVVDVLFLLTMLALLVLRFTHSRSREESYATEVEGARLVQQFLIPEHMPPMAGFAIESDYRPAREVGGDFFQVIPNTEDDSVLILVGDVAGKGIQAGMLATLLVGAARTAATFTTDPALILSTLNNRLYGNGNATCLALRIESNGSATLVNAGHLPPYHNGAELSMDGALPLGTIPDLDFPVVCFHILPGDTLTLISDGILEAQKSNGELFGFERVAEHLRLSSSPAALSLAALAFSQGQQGDDITVLTLTRDVSRNIDEAESFTSLRGKVADFPLP